jgi:hypothetical protein
MDFESVLLSLEKEVRAALDTAVAELVTTARIRLQEVTTELAKIFIDDLAKVEKKRLTSLAEVEASRVELAREVETMHVHQEKQQGSIELNIGGYRYQTSVQTLRRLPHTFFDAYFSGRYEQDVCADGSIFVDRDGEHFGHVLEYMRTGVVSVAEPGALPSVSLLRSLKREFGFYCIELCAEQASDLGDEQDLFDSLISKNDTEQPSINIGSTEENRRVIPPGSIVEVSGYVNIRAHPPKHTKAHSNIRTFAHKRTTHNSLHAMCVTKYGPSSAGWWELEFSRSQHTHRQTHTPAHTHAHR